MPAIVRMPQQPTEAARSYVALLEQEALDSESTGTFPRSLHS